MKSLIAYMLLFSCAPLLAQQAPQKSSANIQILSTQNIALNNYIRIEWVEYADEFELIVNSTSDNTLVENYFIPRQPIAFSNSIALGANDFGVMIDGTPLHIGLAEFYDDKSLNWEYDNLANTASAALAVETNLSYNSLKEYLKNISPLVHSPIIGWAADGFPIYGPYAYEDSGDANSKIKKLSSSYQLKTGLRPDEIKGNYDGTFIRDYEFIKGELNQCNARFTVTPEYPKGTYAYFITDNFPTMPRCWVGIPNSSFLKYDIDTTAYLNENFSGTWYNPQRNGEGILIEMSRNEQQTKQITVSWVTYDQNNSPLYIVGTANYKDSDSHISIEAYTSKGASFGTAFKEQDIINTKWGTLTLEFNHCNEGYFSYSGLSSDDDKGSYPIKRLSTIVSNQCNSVVGDNLNSDVSGTWYEQGNSGEKFLLEALAQNQVKIYWLSYTPYGNPIYILGTGLTDPETGITTIDRAYITSGTSFGADFVTQDIEIIDWGSMIFEYKDCNNASLSYNSKLLDYGSGNRKLTRLRIAEGSGCDK